MGTVGPMTLTPEILRSKTVELYNKLSDPNRCGECWQPITDGERPRYVSITVALSTGSPFELVFSVCSRCHAKGAPDCHKMAEFVSGSLDLEGWGEPLDMESVEKLFLMTLPAGPVN